MIKLIDVTKYNFWDYEYFDEETREWKLKPDAPEWAKKEFEEFYKMVNAEPGESGIITQY